MLKRSLLIITIVISCVGCDQSTKILAKNALSQSDTISLFDDVFRLEYIENKGAFLSMGSELSEDIRYLVLVPGIGLMMLLFAAYLLLNNGISNLVLVAYSMILAGGIGNLADRVFNHGAVVDFLNVGIGSVRTGIFNFADLFIVIGVAIAIIASLYKTQRPT